METLLFATVAINAALLIFIADILGKMMNAVDQLTSKNLITLMVKFSSKSPFVILILNVPLLIAIPYYWIYGFGNWWITGGLVLWLVAGSLSKVYKLPVYQKLAALQSSSISEIEEQHRKFDNGNVFQAILYFLATIVIAFGIF